MCIDLHTHSIYSDGSNTPKELMNMAIKNGIQAISLTDHDTIEGQKEFLTLGLENKITVFSGVEVSSRHHQYSLHVLGYGIDPEDVIFSHWLKAIQEGRKDRNKKILLTLNQIGINMSAEDLLEISPTGLIGRPHIALLLIKKGVVKTFNEAFRVYLGKGKKAWHSRFCYSAKDTIKAIHGAGGIAVIAHPGQLDPHMRKQRSIVNELVDHGLDGLEIFYPSHSKKMKSFLLTLANDYSLIATGGSDFHGDVRPANSLASTTGQFCPPMSILSQLQERIG